MQNLRPWNVEDVLSPEEKEIVVEEVKMNLRRCTPAYLLNRAASAECIPQVLELQEAAYLIPYNNLLTEIKRLCLIDDKDQFAAFLRANHDLLQNYPPDQILQLLCSWHVVGCLAALLESGLHFNINVGCTSGESPLYIAACHLSYGMIELLLYHGADTELHIGDYETPLCRALEEFRDRISIPPNWTDETSILGLLHNYCMPERKEPLYAIRLLAMASNTKKVNDLWMELMNLGRVQEYAALLMVSWDKIMVSSPTPDRGLVNTPVWQYITRVLNNASLQQEIFERTYFRSKEILVRNLTIALDVVKIMWKTIGVLERYYHPSFEIFQKDLSSLVTNELVKNERLDLKPYGANLPRSVPMPKLTSEAKVLLERKYSTEARQFRPILSSFFGKCGARSSKTMPLSFLSRFQYRTLMILNPMEVKPSSHNVLALAKVCAPLMWFAKRSVK